MSPKDNLTEILSLLEKAVDTSSEGITIGIMSEPDRPLIYANQGFERLTGYSVKEVIGKNCRFLQGANTKEEPIDEIRRAIAAGAETTVELLNYKKDGTPFWNRLSISPLKNQSGVVTHYVGIQSDITELKETKRTLELANRELEEFRTLINLELDQASKVQQFILPAEQTDNDHIKFSAFYAPMGRIGGDYYDFIEINKNNYGIMIADVTGHGIPAALLTFMTSFAFKDSANMQLSTEHVVKRTNQKLVKKMPSGSFITMFYAIYNVEKKELTYTQAGHPPGFILRPSTQEVIPLQSKGSILGVFGNDVVEFSEKKIKLVGEDKLFLYSDAIIELKNPNNELLESQAFLDLLEENLNDPLDLLFQKLHQFGCDYSNQTTFNDDLTLIGFEVID